MISFVFTAPDPFFFSKTKCALTEEDMMEAVQTFQPTQSPTELTELGKCLLKHEVSIIWPLEGSRVTVLALCTDFEFLFCQNVCMTLLALSFTSLSWKDANSCHRTGSIICWPFLLQVAFLSAWNMYYKGRSVCLSFGLILKWGLSFYRIRMEIVQNRNWCKCFLSIFSSKTDNQTFSFFF